MTEEAKALQSFWAQVLPSFVEDAVPENTPLPYLTYTLGRASFSEEYLHQVRVWVQGKSFEPLMAYCDKVKELIPESGYRLFLPGGSGLLYLYRGSPFIQNTPMDEDNLKVAYINVIIKNYIL